LSVFEISVEDGEKLVRASDFMKYVHDHDELILDRELEQEFFKHSWLLGSSRTPYDRHLVFDADCGISRCMMFSFICWLWGRIWEKNVGSTSEDWVKLPNLPVCVSFF